jgi:hypothetical protein
MSAYVRVNNVLPLHDDSRRSRSFARPMTLRGFSCCAATSRVTTLAL